MTKVKIFVRSSFFIRICCICRYRFTTPLFTDLYKDKNPRACVYRYKGNFLSSDLFFFFFFFFTATGKLYIPRDCFYRYKGTVPFS